jgi:hypothetical protein
MAKTLRTKADYTIKTGSGASGSNQIILIPKQQESREIL